MWTPWSFSSQTSSHDRHLAKRTRRAGEWLWFTGLTASGAPLSSPDVLSSALEIRLSCGLGFTQNTNVKLKKKEKKSHILLLHTHTHTLWHNQLRSLTPQLILSAVLTFSFNRNKCTIHEGSKGNIKQNNPNFTLFFISFFFLHKLPFPSVFLKLDASFFTAWPLLQSVSRCHTSSKLHHQ